MKKLLPIILIIAPVLVVLGVLLFRQQEVTKQKDITTVPVAQPEPQPVSSPTVSMYGVYDLTNQEVVHVRIRDMKYIPDKIKVSVGTTVTWTNEDDMQHNAMLEHDASEEPHDAPLVADERFFEGPMLNKGESYSYTFTEVSENYYHCAPHPWMTGLVEVVE